MGKVKDVVCPSCNARIHFKEKLGKMKCDYCGQEFDVSVFEQKEEKLEKQSEKTNYDSYNCPDCGAQIIADEQTSATFCLYCGNTAILKNKLDGSFKPDKVIPFKVSKEKAVEAFKNLKKGRPFMPKTFNSESNIEKITGLYVPFWLYEMKVDGSIEVSATRVRSWSVGDTMYTKTDYYKVDRSASMDFEKIPVDGSTRFDNDIMNSIEPFNYEDLVDFNPAYLSGFLAEKYDVDETASEKDAIERAENTAEQNMYNDVYGYATKSIKSRNLNCQKKETLYVLLPVWMVNIKYEDKYYTFAMNGQTAKFVGNVPIDKKKKALYTILILGALVICSFLFIYFVLYKG